LYCRESRAVVSVEALGVPLRLLFEGYLTNVQTKYRAPKREVIETMERKRFDSILSCVALTLLLLVIQRAVGGAARGFANLFSYEQFDPDHAYLWNIVHHTSMAVLALAAILFLQKVDNLEFNLGLGDRKAGVSYVVRYTGALAGITLVVHVLMLTSNSLPTYAFPLNRRNIIGTLFFQLFCTGPAEELLYRALPITIIPAVLGRSVNVGWGISPETIIAALLFSLAHAKWSLFPLTFEAGFFQLLYAFSQGIIEGKAYQDTRSIVYPMVMHSISNVLMVQTGYLFILLS
jgi:membrane protease YdiL (CAAX protease family)